MKIIHLLHLILLLAVGGLCWKTQLVSGRTNQRTLDTLPSARGEYGHRLDLLRRCYTGPKEKGESNHFIDLWGGEDLREFAFAHGLTNNNTLFVISHGKAIFGPGGRRYAYYPDKRLLADGKTPYFSARDLAEMLGPAAAKQIHNLAIASCNMEGVFSPEELRRYFVNATNVIHAPAKYDGHDMIFRHTLIHQSSDIRFLYAMPRTFTTGKFSDTPSNKQFGPYIAWLYKPGAKEPFKKQIAGRELLEPSKASGPKGPALVPAATPDLGTEDEPADSPADSAVSVAPAIQPLIIGTEKSHSHEHEGLFAQVASTTLPFLSDRFGLFGQPVLALGIVCLCVLTAILAVYWIRRASERRRARIAPTVSTQTRSGVGSLPEWRRTRWSEDIVPLKLKTESSRDVVKGTRS